MNDLKQPVGYAVSMIYDNQSTICFAENPIFHASTKHVDTLPLHHRKTITRRDQLGAYLNQTTNRS